MLDVFELDTVEQRAYEALVDSSPATPGDLAATLGVGAAGLRDALTRLEDAGLVSRTPGDPPSYTAASPEVALGVLVLEKEQQLQRSRLYVEQLAARFHKAVNRRDLAELMEVVTGRPAIRQRFAHLQRAARNEIRCIDRPPYTVPAATFNPVEAEQLARGVRYRVIYDSAGLDFHPLHEDLDRSSAQGEEARVLSGTPTKLLLVDERFAMIPLRGGAEAADGLVVIRPSCLLDALAALFETLWSRALPLNLPGDAHVAVDQGRPSADEMRLLALMTAGLPDETIARQFGVSYRTLQRRIRGLLDRLGAQTRFQAGLRAAHLGWLPPPTTLETPVRHNGRGRP